MRLAASVREWLAEARREHGIFGMLAISVGCVWLTAIALTIVYLVVTSEAEAIQEGRLRGQLLDLGTLVGGVLAVGVLVWLAIKAGDALRKLWRQPWAERWVQPPARGAGQVLGWTFLAGQVVVLILTILVLLLGAFGAVVQVLIWLGVLD